MDKVGKIVHIAFGVALGLVSLFLFMRGFGIFGALSGDQVRTTELILLLDANKTLAAVLMWISFFTGWHMTRPAR